MKKNKVIYSDALTPLKKLPDKQSEIEAAAERLLAIRQDPVAWVKAMGDCPWEGQAAILQAIAENMKVAVRSCHGIGKDWVAARIALWFLHNYAPSIVITTGPTDRQVKGILWKEIALFQNTCKAYGYPGDCLTQRLQLDVDWYAWGFTAPPRDTNKIQGFHEKDILVIIDEASGVTPEIYQSLEAVLSSQNARKLEIGNPTDPFSDFAKSFKTPSVKKLAYSCYDTPNFTTFGINEKDMLDGSWQAKIGRAELPWPKLTTPHWVADRIDAGWVPGTALYDARIKGNFPSESPDSLIPLSWIERSSGYASDSKYPVELGVDVAREGTDQTVIVLRVGDHVQTLHEVRGADIMETTGQCVNLRRQYKATAIKVDVCGVGGGVFDRLKEMGEPAQAANAGWASLKPNTYVNARSEWLWELRQRFASNRIKAAPDLCEKLAQQLTEVKWKLASGGQVKIEPKEETKKRIKRSPDHADAVAIVFAEGLKYRHKDDVQNEGGATMFI
jgi:phage terminase large subunit